MLSCNRHAYDDTYGIGLIKGVLKTSYLARSSTPDPTPDPSPAISSDFIYGDLNGDGNVTISDIAKLNLYLHGESVSDFNPYAADVDLDNAISDNDLSILERYNVGLITSLPYISDYKCYYLTPAAAPGYAMDVEGGVIANEINVGAYARHGASNQAFLFVPVYTNHDMSASYYHIIPMCDPTFRAGLNVYRGEREGNLQIYTFSGSENEIWALEEYSDGYRIRSYLGGCLTVDGNYDGANIHLADTDYSDNQKWYLEEVDPAKFITQSGGSENSGSNNNSGNDETPPAPPVSSYTADDAKNDMAVVNAHIFYISENNSNNTTSVVASLQRLLNYVDGANLSVDGICGPATDSEIRAFQRGHGLVVDGQFGTKSKQCLSDIIYGTDSSGDNGGSDSGTEIGGAIDEGVAVTSDNLSFSQSGVDFLCDLESFHPYCYKDSSQSSIGFGTKCTGSSVQPHQSGLHSITREQAMNDLVDQVYSRYAPNVRRQTKNVYMTQTQFDVLVSLCYNTGGGNTIISNSPLVKYLKGELTEAEARSRYSNYYVKSNNVKVQGLVNRRNKEADRFFGSSVSLGSGFSSDSSSYSAEDIRADMDIVNGHYTYIAYNRKQNTKEVVSALQRLLNYFENAELTVDGICGKDTRAAIKSFQRNHDLKVDGRFGVKCKRCMTRLVNAL